MGAALEEGTRVLAGCAPRSDLSPDPDLPDDTRLWAPAACGGTLGRLRLRR